MSDTFDIIDSVYQKKILSKSAIVKNTKSPGAKYSVFDPDEFNKGRQVLGNLIVNGTITSGGTDVDWLVEHKGNFVIFEFKSFHNDKINIPKGQMIAYERLHEKLSLSSKCYLYIIGYDDIDFSNPDSSVWIFEINQWKNGVIPKNSDEKAEAPTRYLVFRDFMTEIKVKDLRDMVDFHWKEFDNI
ncbi:MAG: hypothetical protein GWN01_05685 [Nitrosopumilaceae archaeon]|nr:hypothetical protein [Nitrosopumilaceae archaeon]NIU00433.1 hypothetical protein [Nitrosopumilaceae archaeon]NIU87110.1 hypothetical protein [Nitrosopumilaceae archaeon]NIV65665.1 hypothetical protein [Nitrosopumilaceae archaeon]NIX61035.1 hypothetical protein [Nitrosopumilaceae archaeon]